MSTATATAPTPAAPTPSSDKRWKLVEATMRRHGHAASALIEVLHTVQEVFGFLDDEALKFVANGLKLPLSKVYGVATFYHFFSMRPPGKHTCVVCMGTACYIKGAQQLLDAIDREYGVKAGGTAPDGSLSVLTARCIGSCGLAPAAVVDGEIMGKLNAEQMMTKIRSRMNHDA